MLLPYMSFTQDCENVYLIASGYLLNMPLKFENEVFYGVILGLWVSQVH